MTSGRLLYIGNKLSSQGKTPTGIEILGPLLEGEGYVLRYASSKKGKIARLADMVVALLKYARTSNYVLIDTYSTSNFWFAFVSAVICKMVATPYIPILHGGNLPNRLSSSPRLSRFLFGNAYLNVAPSAYLAEAFRNEGFEVAVVPNPLVDDITAVHRDIFRPRLIWVRSFSSLYNPQMAIEVLKNLASKFADARLTMVGPEVDDNLDKCRQLALSYGLDVSFTGRLSKPEWMHLSTDCDFFINTSNVDNSPFSLVEAAALGLPIVSTNVGGIPYLFTNGVSARLVKKGDAAQMSEAIESLIEDSEYTQNLIQKSLQLAESVKWPLLRMKWLEILKLP
ncbi:glycosyltransferase family 4 protein [Flavobacterium selenitireducens]|uniref:glycosyltransferase family 4 protein n=1 Tax=Flavobacterium selenitireducens TaxID=2722704 RepID=UPI00168ACE22|nr:glycosyltransferase family 4 protein [Flavobacterium selenitireducens]MBD3583424.1 glycosyltransferase family 4 protein [Flavobacterium selenitireducens]